MQLPANVHDDPASRNRTGVFENRHDAGIALAALLERYRNSDAVLLGIPAGGMPVAAAAARRLSLPTDFFVVSKITLPWNTEAGYGAVAADGTWALNDSVVQRAGLDPDTVRSGVERTRRKVERRARAYRGILTARRLRGSTAILIDDGVASGFTLKVAVDAVRKQAPASVAIAVPTGHLRAVVELAAQADQLFCANIRTGPYFAVADAYVHWSDVGDDEVVDILAGLAAETVHG